MAVGDGDRIELLLQRAEEALNPTVLPRALQLGGLQADAEQRQCPAHQARVQADLIVDAQSRRQTIAIGQELSFALSNYLPESGHPARASLKSRFNHAACNQRQSSTWRCPDRLQQSRRAQHVATFEFGEQAHVNAP